MKSRRASIFILTVSVALLVAMIATNATGIGSTHPGTQAYFERVAETISDVPLQSGAWLGVDIPVIPAAQDLLKPNKILQRRYTNANTGESFEILMVHCGDVRDMLGHFPPVCYVANGWTLDQKTPISVHIDDSEADAVRYDFSREADFVSDAIHVVNLFSLPTAGEDSFSPDYATVIRAGRSRRTAGLGSVQVQVIMPASASASKRSIYLETAMRLIAPVLHDVERGPM